MRSPSSLLAIAVLCACAASKSDTSTATPAAVDVRPEPFAVQPLSSDVEANVPVLPEGITSFGAVEHDGVLYVLGGYSGTPHAYASKDQHGELLAYDAGAPATARWSVVSRVPPVQGAALVSHSSGLIRVGGMRAMNESASAGQDLVSIDVVQRFDPQLGTWTDLPALPQGRSSHDAVVIGDTLYVVGGWQLEHAAKGGTFASEMFTLDLASEEATWQRTPTPFARRALAVATAGGKLYAIGGMGSGRDISQNVEIFDPEAQAWTRGPDFPGAGFGMAAVGAGVQRGCATGARSVHVGRCAAACGGAHAAS